VTPAGRIPALAVVLASVCLMPAPGAAAPLAASVAASPAAAASPSPPFAPSASPPTPAPRAGALWDLGRADARLLSAGWRRDPRTGAWSAEVELRLVNRDLHQAFHRPVVIEFVDAAGHGWVWKSFVTLAAGTAQNRSISAPHRLDCAGLLPVCPGLRVRVALKKGEPAAVLADIPRLALAADEAPPTGRPLWVAAVEDGPVLRLLDGKGSRVRPLGLLALPAGSAAAAAWTRAQVMDGPVQLSYDALPPDKAGRWQAYVSLPDGRDLGQELLRRDLVVLDPQAEFVRRAAYQALTPTAR